jgi:hypothetical protein
MVHVLLSFRHTDVNIYISTERFLDTSQFVLVTYSVYHYTVRLRGDPIALLYVTEYVPLFHHFSRLTFLIFPRPFLVS